MSDTYTYNIFSMIRRFFVFRDIRNNRDTIAPRNGYTIKSFDPLKDKAVKDQNDPYFINVVGQKHSKNDVSLTPTSEQRSEPVSKPRKKSLARQSSTIVDKMAVGARELNKNLWTPLIEKHQTNKETDQMSPKLSGTATVISPYLNDPADKTPNQHTNKVRSKITSYYGKNDKDISFSDYKNKYGGKLSKSQFYELLEVYYDCDANNDNKISRKEFYDIIRSLGQNPKESVLDELFFQIDINNNGYLEFEELLKLAEVIIDEKTDSTETKGLMQFVLTMFVTIVAGKEVIDVNEIIHILNQHEIFNMSGNNGQRSSTGSETTRSSTSRSNSQSSSDINNSRLSQTKTAQKIRNIFQKIDEKSTKDFILEFQELLLSIADQEGYINKTDFAEICHLDQHSDIIDIEGLVIHGGGNFKPVGSSNFGQVCGNKLEGNDRNSDEEIDMDLMEENIEKVRV